MSEQQDGALAKLEQAHLGGDKTAVLSAIRFCFETRAQIPAWVSAAYLTALESVRTCQARSWDDVFGQPVPPGAHLHAQRDRLIKIERVYSAIRDMNRKGVPLEEAFATAADEFHIGKRRASDWYYEVKGAVDLGLSLHDRSRQMFLCYVQDDAKGYAAHRFNEMFKGDHERLFLAFFLFIQGIINRDEFKARIAPLFREP